jgi:hypothetical protein
MTRLAMMLILLALAPLTAVAALDPETGRWRASIGDPTVFGWLTVCAYFAAAALLGANLRLARQLGMAWQFWLAVMLLMLALGFNKQLDLQTLFTQVGRDLAIAQGWYQDRRVVQAVFIAGLVVGGAVMVAWMRRWIGSAWDLYRLCAIGVAALLVFIIMRAATFHYVDRMLGLSLAGLRVNVLLELGAIALVAAGAWQWRRRARARSHALAELRRNAA